jgi:lipopolysaccharide/colanic/teichoic acid biosynthesis glycosyltransferase
MLSLILIKICDYIICLLAIIVLFPVYIFVALLIVILDGLPIFFISKRLGKNNKFFNLYKFRTFRNNKITFIGKFLRRSSLDELAQLFNVFLGQMSLVGPRPIPEEIASTINENDLNLRHSILPGMTGYTQINYSGKNREWHDKIVTDIFYIINVGIKLYFIIIIATFFTLILRYKKNKSGKSL